MGGELVSRRGVISVFGDPLCPDQFEVKIEVVVQFEACPLGMHLDRIGIAPEDLRWQDRKRIFPDSENARPSRRFCSVEKIQRDRCRSARMHRILSPILDILSLIVGIVDELIEKAHSSAASNRGPFS